MTTLVTLEAVVKPELLEQFVAFLRKHIPDTRRYRGCEDITAYLDEDGHTVVMVEHWQSKALYQAYLSWREETGVLSELAGMLQSAPAIRFAEVLDA